MESIIEEITHITWTAKGNCHPDTIEFWRSVSRVLEQGKNNLLATHLNQKEYQQVRRLAYVGSNRVPCNEIQICSAECVSNGYDT
jgi:hypothetical protein